MAGHDGVGHLRQALDGARRQRHVGRVEVATPVGPEVARHGGVRCDHDGEAVAVEAQAMMAERVPWRWKDIDDAVKRPWLRFHFFRILPGAVQNFGDTSADGGGWSRPKAAR